MSAKFTPGPWFLRLSDNATPHIEHGDCLLNEVGELESQICVMPAEISTSFNSLANATLIAAAPDLLDALRALLNAHAVPSTACKERPVYEAARAAIAKALGEQP